MSRKSNENILNKAESLVYGDRHDAYGHPRDNQKYIAGLFNA